MENFPIRTKLNKTSPINKIKDLNQNNQIYFNIHNNIYLILNVFI